MCFIILIAAGPHGGGPGQVCPGVLSTRCTLLTAASYTPGRLLPRSGLEVGDTEVGAAAVG